MNARDIVAAHYAASARGDLPGMLEPLAEDALWTEMEGSPYAGTFVGPAAIAESVFARIDRDWEDFSVTISQLHAAGDSVIGVGRYTGTHRGTGRRLDVRVAHVWRVEAGRIVAFEQFTDTALLQQAGA